MIQLLFLCTNNAVRSIMAEALLRHHGGETFQVYSAGSDPLGTVNPNAIALLRQHEYHTAQLRSKSWDEFIGVTAPSFDIIITLSDEVAREVQSVRPRWRGNPLVAHWGLPAPVAVQGDEAAKRQAFADTLRRLQQRITRLINLPFASLDQAALQRHLETIGRMP